MKIVDAHIHLMDLSLGIHPGFSQPSTNFLGSNAPICRSFLLDDLLAEAGTEIEIVKAVNVEALSTDRLAESRYVQNVADRAGMTIAIVAGVDFSSAHVQQELEAQRECKHLRGVRQILNRHPDSAYNYVHVDYMADPVWQQNFKLLRRFDLSFDMQLYPHQFGQSFQLIADNPDIQFVINHAGMFADRNLAGWRVWRDGIRRFAAFANVAIKLSGFGMLDHHWTVESIRPYCLEILDAFGMERVMFASNFPVDKLFGRYPDVWRAFATITADVCAEEKHKLFAANAERIYRIMIANPILGVLFHWLGGLAAGSFYVPYRAVRHWSWEVYWIAGGVVSWLIAPLIFAILGSRDVFGVLAATPTETLLACYLFGVLWGFGGLTFGLTMRYLGMSLGMAIALGFSAAFGTLLPPLLSGTFLALLGNPGGAVTLLGVVLCLVGIMVVGLAGRHKERQGANAVHGMAEFNLRKGLWVAVFSGIMSSCFSYGLNAGGPIRTLSLAAGTAPLMQSLPVLVVVLWGGFTTNIIWSSILMVKNRSGGQFFLHVIPASRSAEHSSSESYSDLQRVPLLRNYLLCAMAGLTWYLQFYFYSQGEVWMGPYGFASWTLHMASIILFSSLWGFALKEWKGAGRAAIIRLWVGLLILVLATAMIGLANLLE